MKIFTHPSQDAPEGPPPHAKFEGLYYSVRDAKVGDRVEKGNLIRTAVGGRARVIYDNGDQIYVASATSYKINWEKDAPDGKPELELRYGKARFVIQKGGPRTGLRIKTKSAVLGVRGTDFFVAVNEATGETEEATLRGVVEVKPPVENAPSTSVATGQTAAVPQAPAELAPAPGQPPAQVPRPPEVKVHTTTQQELQAVERNTSLAKPEPTPPEVQPTVKTLEDAAAKTTLEDIRAVDPAQADKVAQASAQAPSQIDAINQATIDQLARKAPKKGEIGPIADVSLEKPKEPEKKEEIKEEPKEEPPPTLPRFWVGIKGGHLSSHLDGYTNGGGNCNGGGNGCVSTENHNRDSGIAGITAEYELGRNFSLVAEFYPHAEHGEQLYTFCSGSGCPSGIGSYDFKITSTDLVLGVRPQLPFGRYRVFALFAEAISRFSKITSANLDSQGTGKSQDLSDSVPGLTVSVGGGFGVAVRPWEHLKLSAELRFTHGITKLDDNQVNYAGLNTGIGDYDDVEALAGVSYGF